MAILINGSTNVITGVAVGGLPDGIVDTDMIATNAVTNAKANPGLGKVLQKVYGYGSTGETQTTSTSYVATALSIDITPTASNSILYILVTGGSCYGSNGDGIELTLYRKIGSGSYTAMNNTQSRPSDSLWRFYGNGAAGQMGCAFEVKDADHNTTSTITYKVYVRSTNGGYAQFNNHHQDSAGMSVIEVSA